MNTKETATTTRKSAQLLPAMTPEYAALRVWAANIRDNGNGEYIRTQGKALCLLLDIWQDTDSQAIKNSMWTTIEQLQNAISERITCGREEKNNV